MDGSNKTIQSYTAVFEVASCCPRLVSPWSSNPKLRPPLACVVLLLSIFSDVTLY